MIRLGQPLMRCHVSQEYKSKRPRACMACAALTRRRRGSRSALRSVSNLALGRVLRGRIPYKLWTPLPEHATELIHSC